MLNEGAYKATYDEVVKRSCPFEKAILNCGAACDQTHKFSIAEREAVACETVVAWQNCKTLHGLLRQNATFALKLAHPGEPLPHAKEVKVQCGGLLGVQRLFESEATSVGNVHALVGEVQKRFGTMQDLPFQEVVKVIAVYEGRRRR